MPSHAERIVILETRRGQATSIQRELRSSGYPTVLTPSPARVLDLLSQGPVDLIILTGSAFAQDENRNSETTEAGLDSRPGRGFRRELREYDPYHLSRVLKADPVGRKIPLLLLTAAWERGALARGLESGMDYFLFAPCLSQQLLRAVRTALLNGASEEPAEANAKVEILHGDRMYTLTAGPDRLARALFSLYEDLQQTKAALSWREAEFRALWERMRRERHPSRPDVRWRETLQGIAHDFANVIETIGAAGALAGTATPPPVDCSAAREAALAQAACLLSILQNLALYGEVEVLLEPVDPAAVVRATLQAALLPLRAPNVRVQVRGERLPPMRSNATLLVRCVSNLIWNAVQAMPEGGTLDIAGYLRNGRVVLEVSDTGPGIPKEMQERVFDADYSTKSGHSGLGLPLVRDLVRRGGGEITLVSRPGRGATFALAFPLADAPALLAHAPGRARRATPVESQSNA